MVISVNDQHLMINVLSLAWIWLKRFSRKMLFLILRQLHTSNTTENNTFIDETRKYFNVIKIVSYFCILLNVSPSAY